MRRPRGSLGHLPAYYYFPQEPQVQLTVGNKPIDFLVDMGTTYTMLNTKVTKKSWGALTDTGVTGQLPKQAHAEM